MNKILYNIYVSVRKQRKIMKINENESLKFFLT